jgi:hypothetical protein
VSFRCILSNNFTANQVLIESFNSRVCNMCVGIIRLNSSLILRFSSFISATALEITVKGD